MRQWDGQAQFSVLILCRRTFARTLRRTDKPKTVTHASKYALVIRRVIDEKGRYFKTVIDIKSRPLLEVLKQINDGIEGVDLDRADAELSDSHLFHSYHGLLRHLEIEQARGVQNADLISDLKAAIYPPPFIAIRVVTDDQAHNLREHDAIRTTKQVGWSSLTLLFKPNTIVYNFQSDVREDCLLIVREIDLTFIRKDYRRFAVVWCDAIRNDGTSFGYARQHFEIDEYKGVRGVTDLDIYPIEFHASGESILSSAKRRGGEIARLEPHWFREYDGPGLRMRPLRPDETQDSDPGERKFNIPERFLVSPSVLITAPSTEIAHSPRTGNRQGYDQPRRLCVLWT
ncbi:hypothetical protein EXIGLDRAFT_607520 [Exidia glandulosa HHB12029]|uniref:DUF7025 domain-containing protein n=1 Tax=Exidia glandulosa HHB12029 TaxID=1314781 RepID=A0A165LGN5_EXIGL|nr:hypothetical protein EXIGLDRAFT_607520 [Exidia glandulosa HHB12029]